MTEDVLDDPLLTTDEVASIFSVSRETIRDWIEIGVLEAVKFGQRWRIRRSEVRRLIQSKYLEEE